MVGGGGKRVNPGSQLPLNVSVSFDFESTIMLSRYFFFLVWTNMHARAPAHISKYLVIFYVRA